MSPVEEQQIESFRWTFAREQPIVGKIPEVLQLTQENFTCTSS